MTRIAERTVVFADLRGSTSLFERLGNAEATSVVTHTISALARAVHGLGGHVVKTLGDGLLALFDRPDHGVACADAMHDTLDDLVNRGRAHGASSGLRALRLQVALARGEIVEMNSDCFGDAVNVAARLLDHAGDNETLITDGVFAGLDSTVQSRFRSLDWMHLRGRAEPVLVHLLGGKRFSDTVVTQFGNVEPSENEPDGIRLVWRTMNRLYSGHSLPVVLGRSPQSTFCVDDSRVSRSHARIDWHGGNFTLSDLSYNGTYVRFSGGEVLSLRRGTCTLHDSGVIGLGGSPSDPSSATVRFDVLVIAETQPQDPGDLP